MSATEVEICYFRSRGLWDEEPEPDVTLREIVQAVIHKYQMPADRCWNMTVSDLLLMLNEPKTGNERVDDKTAQKMMCLELDRRFKLREELSLNERIELNEWVVKLTS